MSMYALLRNNPLPTHKEMESAFEGIIVKSIKGKTPSCFIKTVL